MGPTIPRSIFKLKRRLPQKLLEQSLQEIQKCSKAGLRSKKTATTALMSKLYVLWCIRREFNRATGKIDHHIPASSVYRQFEEAMIQTLRSKPSINLKTSRAVVAALLALPLELFWGKFEDD